MYKFKSFLYFLYSLVSSKKVAIVRDIKTKTSFVYHNANEADYIVKEQCDSHFNFSHKPDVDTNGLKGIILPENIILMVVELHSVVKSNILTFNEKMLIINSALNKESDLLTQT